VLQYFYKYLARHLDALIHAVLYLYSNALKLNRFRFFDYSFQRIITFNNKKYDYSIDTIIDLE